MRWRSAQAIILVALALLGVGAAAWLLIARTGTGAAPHAGRADQVARRPGRSAPAPPADPPQPATTYATVDAAPAGAPQPAGFLGLSLEYSALEAYTGADPGALDPVFVQLLRNLGQPVLRIGGNSTDATWWPVPGTPNPPGVSYDLTPAWLASARALAGAVGAKLILGVNLAVGRPRLSAIEARALLAGVGAGNVEALELGNEPDVYGVFPWYRAHGRPVYARPPGYGLTAFIQEVKRWTRSLPPAPLAGPATAELAWLPGLPALIAAEPALRVITVHRYPIQGCLTNPASPAYPSIANLLSDHASQGLAQSIAPYVALAHAQGRQFRVDELNSAALAGCLGHTGVSNTFAAALWMLDTLFEMDSVGVDGVNVHTLPGAAYELFTFSRRAAGWQAFVHPDYYGMLMFAQAFPPGAQLLPVHAPAGPVKVWATRGADGHTRVTLINEDSVSHRVEVQLPFAGGQAELEWLRAPSLSAASGVTLGGQSFGNETTTGVLAAPRLEPVAPLLGTYSVQLPPDSAALLIR